MKQLSENNYASTVACPLKIHGRVHVFFLLEINIFYFIFFYSKLTTQSKYWNSPHKKTRYIQPPTVGRCQIGAEIWKEEKSGAEASVAEPVLFGRSRSRCIGPAPAPAPTQIKQTKLSMIFSLLVPTLIKGYLFKKLILKNK